MITDLLHKNRSYHAFIRELEYLLNTANIATGRKRVSASVESRKNRIGTEPVAPTPKIGRVIIYLEKHLADELSLDQLAEVAQLSKYQLIRKFRSDVGTTPWKYLIRKRIDKARELLEAGMPPGQTAVETGFHDQSHLNRAFREETGTTPKAYQEENFKNTN